MNQDVQCEGPVSIDASTRKLLGAAGFIAFTFHLLLNGRYGFFRDELYFIACGQHLSWGYVDQPPLIALVARIATTFAGQSLTGFRVLADAAAAALVVLTGALAHRLGGQRYAVVLAMLAVGFAPDSLVRGHLLTMNSFEPVIWLAIAYVLVWMVQAESPRAWLSVGLLVGVGILNKYSTVFYVVALLVAMLATAQRRLLASPRVLVAIGISSALVLPNVFWQASRHWPMLELLHKGQTEKNAEFHFLTFFADQYSSMGLFVPILLIAGLTYLVLEPAAARFRFLGIATIVGEVLLVGFKAKPYYATPLLPPLIAVGSVAVAKRLPTQLWLRSAVAALIVVGSAILAPMAVPLLSVETFIAYQRSLGIKPAQLEKKEYRELPQHFADQFGWPEMTRAVADAWAQIPASERANTGLYTQNYGEAGALDFFGKQYGLPPARSGHNQYYFWSEELPNVTALLIVGGKLRDHQEACSDVNQMRHVPAHPYVMPYEDELPIFYCKELRKPLAEIWPGTRHFD